MASIPPNDGVAAEENGHENGNGPSHPPAVKRPRSVISAAQIRAEFEHHEAGVARVNNGSFGCCQSSLLDAQARWQRLFLAQPDDFYFHGLQPALRRSRAGDPSGSWASCPARPMGHC